MAHSMTSPMHTVCIVSCSNAAMIFFFYNEKHTDISCILFFCIVNIVTCVSMFCTFHCLLTSDSCRSNRSSESNEVPDCEQRQRSRSPSYQRYVYTFMPFDHHESCLFDIFAWCLFSMMLVRCVLNSIYRIITHASIVSVYNIQCENYCSMRFKVLIISLCNSMSVIVISPTANDDSFNFDILASL